MADMYLLSPVHMLTLPLLSLTLKSFFPFANIYTSKYVAWLSTGASTTPHSSLGLSRAMVVTSYSQTYGIDRN